MEFETAADLKTAVEKLDGLEFKGQTVQCVADVRWQSYVTTLHANILSASARHASSRAWTIPFSWWAPRPNASLR